MLRFNHTTRSWQVQALMNRRRWYPVTTAHARMLFDAGWQIA